MSDDSIAALRQDYSALPLDLEATDPDPFVQFQRWFDAARNASVSEPNAMALATVDEDGRPSVRTVLLKGVDEGFVFFTNYESRKAAELDRSATAALCFWWQPLARQVRIEGSVERVSAEDSDSYFASRPRGSQIGAHASPQSQAISRSELEKRFRDLEERFDGRDVPRPESWGGYRLSPNRVEFWQGRPSRLHDRILYRLDGDAWVRERLAP